MRHVKRKTRKTRNALRNCICTIYGTVIVNVSRTSLSVMPKADMKSSDTVTDGSSKVSTIGKRALRRQAREGERKRERGKQKKKKIRMLR